jgi:ribosomal protein S18 acetylase RimI-like enzyme
MYRVDLASSADVPELHSLHQELVGIEYDWASYLGGGGADDYLALALREERTGDLAGYLGWGTFAFRGQGPLGAQILRPGPERPWVKLHALGVAPDHRRQGIGKYLLACALHTLPPDVLGVFGNVEPHRHDAIQWYRRRGFNIAPMQSLHNPIDENAPTFVWSEDQEYHFAARRETIEKYLNNARTEEQERQEAALDPVLVFHFPPTSIEPGFASVGKDVVAQSTRSCRHMSLGPRASSILAWDPELLRTCASCSAARCEALRNTEYESDTFCDGCRRHRPGVMSGLTEVGTIIVEMGLCPACQLLPPRHRVRTAKMKARTSRKTKRRRR